MRFAIIITLAASALVASEIETTMRAEVGGRHLGTARFAEAGDVDSLYGGRLCATVGLEDWVLRPSLQVGAYRADGEPEEGVNVKFEQFEVAAGAELLLWGQKTGTVEPGFLLGAGASLIACRLKGSVDGERERESANAWGPYLETGILMRVNSWHAGFVARYTHARMRDRGVAWDKDNVGGVSFGVALGSSF